jgi:hypothetical protein
VKVILEKQKNSHSKSKELNSNRLDENYSFQDSGRVSIHSSNKSKNEGASSIKPFDASSIKKLELESPKIKELSGLEESPIVPNKARDFVKSKYYVQPIPAKKQL